MRKSISEIITQTGKFRKKEDRVNFLKENMSPELKNILIATYDTNKIKFLLPDTPPPYTPSEPTNNHLKLYREAKKLKYFVEGWAPPGLKQNKRENIFIQMLESVHADDASILLQMIKQEPFKNIPIDVMQKATDYEIT